ncbi:hypothetical protein ACFL6S_34235 [Candidatus Poribacteria bacterium]
MGVWAGDIVRVVRYLESREDVDHKNISIIAYGEMCPVAIHAAVFEGGISKVALVEPLISYRSIVMNRYYSSSFIHATVAGALTAYDLPDLAGCIAPRKLLMVNITDQNKDKAGSELIEKDLAITRFSYSAAGAEENLEIRSWESGQTMDEIFSAWLDLQ